MLKIQTNNVFFLFNFYFQKKNSRNKKKRYKIIQKLPVKKKALLHKPKKEGRHTNNKHKKFTVDNQ